jgi:hypothetical protein
MRKLTFDFRKDADLNLITQKISDFFGSCAGDDPTDAELVIREKQQKQHEITLHGWNAGQNPKAHEVAQRLATFIVQYTAGKDDYFFATAEVSFPPTQRA